MRARTRLPLSGTLLLTFVVAFAAWAAEILGTRPGYLESDPGSVPN